MHRIPALLIAVRLLLGPTLLWAALTGQPRVWMAVLLGTALASDIFDGVIARRLGVATARLRVADSYADAWYYACVALAVWLTHPAIVRDLRGPLIAVLLLQGCSWLLQWVKYGRPASYHAYTAKLWGLTLFIAGVSILVFGAGLLLWPAIVAGLLGNMEGIAMTLILPQWTHDVSGLAAALRLRAAPGQASARLSRNLP